MCSHDPILGTNKNRILKNGWCERAFTSALTSVPAHVVPWPEINRKLEIFCKVDDYAKDGGPGEV